MPIELDDPLPTDPEPGSVGEALAAALHWARGKKTLTDNGDGTFTLRVYRAHAEVFDGTTLFHSEVLDHPTAPSTVTPQ